MTNTLICRRCAAPAAPNAKYCPNCGHKLVQTQITLSIQSFLLLLGLAGVVTFSVTQLGASLVGKAPTHKHSFTDQQPSEQEGVGMDQQGGPGSQPAEGEPSAQSRPVVDDAETKELRAAVEKNPADIGAKKALVEKLWSTLPATGDVPAPTVLDLVDLLGQIIQAQPKDETTLLMLANLTFNQKIFPKSVEFYKRYLDLKPEDLEARSSYASALTFVGKLDDALHELDAVLQKNPKYFQALAYKTIALGQAGKIAESIALGQEALKQAPNKEARERFAAFIDSLSAENKGGINPDLVPSVIPPTPAAAMATGSQDPVTAFVKNHPVTGSKFVESHKNSDGSIQIIMKEFPMDKMPPMMRDSFLAKVQAAAQSDQSIKKIEFVDADTKTVMVTVNDVKH